MFLTDIPNVANSENRLRKIILEIYQSQEDCWENLIFSVKIFPEIMNWSKYHGGFSNNNLESAGWVQQSFSQLQMMMAVCGVSQAVSVK